MRSAALCSMAVFSLACGRSAGPPADSVLYQLCDANLMNRWEGRSLSIDTAGRIVVGALHVTQQADGPPSSSSVVIRLSSDGASDPEFGAMGQVAVNESAPRLDWDIGTTGVVTDRAGRVLVADAFGDVRRYAAHGALDPSFTPISGGTPHVSLALDAEERILVAGAGTLRRFNSDGLLDSTFGAGAVAIGMDSPDCLVASSTTATVAQTVDLPPGGATISRYVGDGTVDQAFGDLGTAVLPVSGWWHAWLAGCAGSRADGSLVFTGKALRVPHGHTAVAWKVRPDGMPDAGFGAGGILEVPVYSGGASTAPAIDSHARIIVVTTETEFPYPTLGPNFGRVRRLLPSGALDTTFGAGGVWSFRGTPGALALDAAERQVLVGARDGCLAVWRSTP